MLLIFQYYRAPLPSAASLPPPHSKTKLMTCRVQASHDIMGPKLAEQIEIVDTFRSLVLSKEESQA